VKQLLVVYLQLLSLLLQLVESGSRLLDQVRRGHVGRRGSGGNEGLCYCSGLSGPSRSGGTISGVWYGGLPASELGGEISDLPLHLPQSQSLLLQLASLSPHHCRLPR
jgi:hypothetical protein